MARQYKTKNGSKGKVTDDMLIVAGVARLRGKLLRYRRVCIDGFGCFEIRRRAPRKFWNDAGKKYSHVKENFSVNFKPSQRFTSLIRGLK